ncbi:PD-(D/E)XK nuclease family protein [Tenacibaculum dicentrarchi]|uniref:PD-(D/E)XK nuclease family protein n=1 Tax=Tenacibaculum dicentrarchi TaxID=669041 RepID=UPI0035142287
MNEELKAHNFENKITTTNQPNIFHFATSELSQDAFIAWLLSWANKEYETENKALHQLGLNFLASLLSKQNIVISDISNLEIKTQFHKIDVFVSFKMDNKHYGIIIEDKVHTTDHNNQLERYLNKIKELNSKTVIIPIYFKTGYQVNLTRIIENGYHYYTVKDLLNVLTQKKVLELNNDILTHYHSYILGKEKEFDNAEKEAYSYLKTPLSQWKWWTCVKFFHEYKQDFNAGWGSVGNKREPLLAFWFGGSNFSMKDVENNKTINLEIYSDVQFVKNKLKINYRIGLKGNHQKNNKNRNKIFEAFKTYLDNENISYKKAHFRSAKDTIKLVEITEINDAIYYSDLVAILKRNESISTQFAKEYKDA